jgi:hypothetical protein
MSVSVSADVQGTFGPIHELMLELVPPGVRVLAVGPLTGALRDALHTRLGCSVKEVEVLSEMVAHPLEKEAPHPPLSGPLGDDRFTAILLMGVLELADEPTLTLQRVRSLLGEGGALIASIQNGASASIRLELLDGTLQSIPRRLLTRERLRDIFESAGYVVTHWLRQRDEVDPVQAASQSPRVPEAIREWLWTEPEAMTARFVVRAAVAEEGGMLHDLRAELSSARADQAAARDQLAGTRRELRALTERLTAMSEREAELREMLLDAHDQLLRRDDELETKLQGLTTWAQDAARDVVQRDGTILDLQQRLATSQTELDASRTELDASKAELEAGRAELEIARQMFATRAWRLATLYWGTRNRFRRALRLG